MKRFIYVRCEVRNPEPGQVGLINSIYEKASGVAVPDVVPQVWAGSLSFRHAFVWAKDENDAYSTALLDAVLPDLGPDVVCMNDYVAEIPNPPINSLNLTSPPQPQT